jgi:hypothetical protein
MAASGVSKCGGRSVGEVLALVVVDAVADDAGGSSVADVDGPAAAVDDRPAPQAASTETDARNKASNADRFIDSFYC